MARTEGEGPNMAVRPFNSETDASITHVDLVARPANGDEGGGYIVPHVWTLS